MIKVNTERLLSAARLIGSLGTFINHASKTQDNPFATDVKLEILDQVNSIKKNIDQINVPLTKISMSRLISDLEEDVGPTQREFASRLDEIMERMLDEFDTLSVYALPSDRAHFFFNTNPFGQDFSTAFPSASYEAEEFCKCYALDRSTAAVFHLMRVMEIAVRAVAKSLGIPDPVRGQDKNWGAMLQKIKSEMDRRNNPPAWNNNDKEFFQSFYASIDAVRAAWRNTTMHIENKYTPDEANHIYVAVLGLLRPLANRMDEHGLPSA